MIMLISADPDLYLPNLPGCTYQFRTWARQYQKQKRCWRVFQKESNRSSIIKYRHVTIRIILYWLKTAKNSIYLNSLNLRFLGSESYNMSHILVFNMTHIIRVRFNFCVWDYVFILFRRREIFLKGLKFELNIWEYHRKLRMNLPVRMILKSCS